MRSGLQEIGLFFFRKIHNIKCRNVRIQIYGTVWEEIVSSAVFC